MARSFRLFIAGGPLLPVHSSNELANNCALLRYGEALEPEFEPLKRSFRDFHKCLLLLSRRGIIRVWIVLREILKPHVRIFPRPSALTIARMALEMR